MALTSTPKSLRGSLLCVLSQEIRNINFFLGAQNGEFCLGASEFMLTRSMCFFCLLVGHVQKGTATGGPGGRDKQRNFDLRPGTVGISPESPGYRSQISIEASLYLGTI